MMMVWWSTPSSSFMNGSQMDLRAVMGSGMFLKTLEKPGISFNLYHDSQVMVVSVRCLNAQIGM